MLLPYPCLAPHHSLSGTPSSHVWNPYLHLVCHHLHLVYHHLHLVYHHLSGTPPSLHGTPPMSGIPPHYWNLTAVWNPIMCPEITSHLLTGIPPQCPIATILHTVPHPHLAIATPIWPLTVP